MMVRCREEHFVANVEEGSQSVMRLCEKDYSLKDSRPSPVEHIIH